MEGTPHPGNGTSFYTLCRGTADLQHLWDWHCQDASMPPLQMVWPQPHFSPLRKANCSIHPIAVGETLCRLITKVASSAVRKLLPFQVRVGVAGAVDLVAHTSHSLLRCSAMLQVDFKNAFSCLDHTHFLTALEELCPDLLPWAHWCYAKPMPLYLGNGQSLGQRGTAR